MKTSGIDFGLFFHSLSDLEKAVHQGKKNGLNHFVAFPMNRDPDVIDWVELALKWEVTIDVPHLFFKEGKFRRPRKLHAPIALVLDSIQLQEAYANFLKAHDYGSLVLSFPHEKSLSAHGMAHESRESFVLGLPELSPLQESLRVARDCELAQYFGLRLHFHQISCKSSVDTIRAFRSRGLPITAGVSALHLLASVKDLVHFEGRYKTLPPLRESQDQMSLWSGIADGTISNLCSGLINYQEEDNFFEARMGAYGLGHFMPQLQDIFSRPPYSLKQLSALVSKNPATILQGGRV